jgi:hypothetical protein
VQESIVGVDHRDMSLAAESKEESADAATQGDYKGLPKTSELTNAFGPMYVGAAASR